MTALTDPLRLVFIDNFDSFTWNLVDEFARRGAEVEVWRNTVTAAHALERARTRTPSLLVLSPGPGAPSEAGVCPDMVRHCADAGQPMLGVCLGHQAIGVAFGATVTRAPELLHGKTSQVHHKAVGVLAGMPDPFTATRYHSLAVVEDTLPAEIEVTGRTESGIVMALRHRTLPIEGVQFHPESVLTEGGHHLLANWLVRCGDPAALARAPGFAAEMDALRATAFASA